MSDDPDFECGLCLNLLYRPVTTVCGHSFCKSCLLQSVSHHSNCPICRSVLPLYSSEATTAVNVLLEKVLRQRFPEEYRARQDEVAQEQESGTETAQSPRGPSSPGQGSLAVLPFCVLDSILPRQKMTLHVFEPRYILMIERCLQTSRRFGMVGATYANHRGHRHQIANYGTEVEITEIQPTRDGRFNLTVVGRRSFKIEEQSPLDGYMLGKVSWCNLDNIITDDDIDMHQSAELEPKLNEWIATVRSGGWERTANHLDFILEYLGPMPPKHKPDDRAMWVAAMVNPVPPLGVAPEIRSNVLAARTTAQRLEICHDCLAHSSLYMTPSTLNTVIKKAAASIGWRPSPSLLRGCATMIPWVVLVSGLIVNSFVFASTNTTVTALAD
eukprot:m.66765 g.66765  ORF g.66765 m.66765 type:complete len:385 (-) comp23723_c0_seq2:90-1244(-)